MSATNASILMSGQLAVFSHQDLSPCMRILLALPGALVRCLPSHSFLLLFKLLLLVGHNDNKYAHVLVVSSAHIYKKKVRLYAQAPRYVM